LLCSCIRAHTLSFILAATACDDLAGLHLDQNPFAKPGFECVQGMMPLLPVTDEVGGLQVRACVCAHARVYVHVNAYRGMASTYFIQHLPACVLTLHYTHTMQNQYVAYTRLPAAEPHTYRSCPSRTHGKQLPVSKRGTLISHTVVIGVLLRSTRTTRRSAAQCFSTPTQVRPIYMLSDPQRFVWKQC
jgi:hypothetical protein